MRSSESIAQLAPALVKAIAKIEGAAKSAKNPHFKSKYATLEKVIDASREVLAENGLALIQLPGALANGALTLETMILHTSGEWIAGDFQIALGKADPQGVGSAITYARRYAQMAALNMPAVDDDAEAAHGRGDVEPKPANEERNGLGPTPEGPDWWGANGPGATANAYKKAGGDQRFEELRAEIGCLASGEEWRGWCGQVSDEVKAMPKAYRVILRQEAEEQARELGIDLNHKRAA